MNEKEHIRDKCTACGEPLVLINDFSSADRSGNYCRIGFALHQSEKAAIQSDAVNHPQHYTTGSIECIDAIEASMTKEEFQGYLKGCIVKYVWRYRHKNNPQQDLEKMLWYGNRLRATLTETK